MSFAFATPLALGLGLLVALPILAHMTRQAPTDRVPFGAMLLVQRLVKRLRRRRTIKDRWLLLLRALGALLAILGVAGPVLYVPGDPPEVGGSGRVVVVVDRSMSMSQVAGGTSLLERARSEAIRRLEALPAGTRVGVVAYSGEAEVLTAELTEDLARATSLVRGIEPSLSSTDLRAGLLEARRLLGGEPGEVLLFTDEAGPGVIDRADPELMRLVDLGSAVIPVPIHAEPPRNVAVISAAYGDGIEGGQVVVRVMNHGPEAVEVACEVELPDGAQIPVFVQLPPEGPAEARITVPREAAGGVGEVHCDDPDLPADDRRWFHLPRVGASRVLVVDGDPGDTPLDSEVYFLERALAPWGGTQSGVTPDVISPLGLSVLDPEVHRVVFLANVGDPRPMASQLQGFVRRGGNLVVGLGTNVTAERYQTALGPLLPTELTNPKSLADRAERPVPLQMPDAEHPLFAPFRSVGRAGFTRAGAWRVVGVEPYEESRDTTTLLRYEGGVPALIEHRVGAGRVLLWTSTLDRGWTNLPMQAVFMPLMQRMVVYLGAEASGLEQRLSALVGDPVEVDLPEGVEAVSVTGPQGRTVAHRDTPQGVRFVPEQPGAYQIAAPGSPPLAWVAVNTLSEESDVRRYGSVRAAEARLEPDLFRREIDLGGGALGGSLALLVLSGLLARGGRA